MRYQPKNQKDLFEVGVGVLEIYENRISNEIRYAS